MILLSFDIEEFDMPFEYGKTISFQEQMDISIAGTKKILQLLKKHHIKATFFSTVVFAQNARSTIQEILQDGHEIASHGFYHSQFSVQDYLLSKQSLEEMTQQSIKGFRMARMQAVDDDALRDAAYEYNSSINPTYLPGRYNNLKVSRRFFHWKGVLQIPASVTPLVRFPLFWLSFHNIPLRLYQWLCRQTLRKDKYLNIYFHPWEFIDLSNQQKFNFPFFVSKNTGDKMYRRMDKLLFYFKNNNFAFVTMGDFAQQINKKQDHESSKIGTP